MAYKTYRAIHWDTKYRDNDDLGLFDDSIVSILPLTMGGVTWTIEEGTRMGAMVEDKYLNEILLKLENLNPVVDSE